MNESRDIIADEEVFTQAPRITLADVLDRVEAEFAGTRLRDTRSAFRALETSGKIDLSATVATAASLRAIFASLSPRELGIGRKRYDNIRSALTRAVRDFGQRRTWITREMPHDPKWKELLDSVRGDRQYRWGLNRLACYCTAKDISPDEVTIDTLLGLFTAMEAEAVSKDPRNLLKRTITCWNHCRREVPGWPVVELRSPFKSVSFMMPLDAFPSSFQEDVRAWEHRMSNPAPLEPGAPVRAYRDDTLRGYRYTFRRLATALARSGLLPVEEIRDLSVFFQKDRFKAALRPFLKGGGVKTAGYAYKMASQLLVVGRHHIGLDEEQLKPFAEIQRRLKPRDDNRMGDRNRERLKQFDDGEVVTRLLRFPEEELDRALRSGNELRRAKGVERALAISLAIFTGLRIKNLRQLRLDRHLERRGNRVFVSFAEDDMKTHRELELELPRETIELLDLHLDEHRDKLPGAESPFLFPGQGGGPRSYSAMRDALSRTLRKHAGIEMSPHLYRHAIAKIIVERWPELALDVSRRLGHKSINTTYQSYLGTEGPAASRRINALLHEVRGQSRGDE